MNAQQRRAARVQREVQSKIQAAKQREEVRMHKRMTGIGGVMGFGPLWEELSYFREQSPEPIGAHAPTVSPGRKTEW